jgi:O-antigen ligase
VSTGPVVPRLVRSVTPQALVLAAGTLAGWSVVVGGRGPIGLCALLSVAVGGAALLQRRVVAFPRGFAFVELPIVLLVAEVYESRPRSSDQLAADPLDIAAQAKIGLIVLALLIGTLALATGPAIAPRTSFPFRLFALYVAVVFLGTAFSVDPSLTAFRALELAAAVIVVGGAYRHFGREAAVRIECVLYASVFALVASVWLGLLIAPRLVVVPAPASPVPWQLEGAFPAIASNGVGTLGLLLALWSLGRLYEVGASARHHRPIFLAAAVLGLVTLVGAQYRTGYIAFAVGIAVLLAFRTRKTLAFAGIVMAVAVTLWGSATATRRSEPFLLRGDSTTQARTLSGRVSIWRHAIPVWRESPLVGRGLMTATRLEVLPSLGLRDTATVHGTWIEALVGTGVLGAGLLAASVLVLLGRALSEGLRPGGRIVPALLVSALLVRSTTGSSIESLGLGALILLALALELRKGAPA